MSTTIERFNKWATSFYEIQDRQKQLELSAIIAERAEKGCAVRSLESAFGVEATDEEWDMRIADVREFEVYVGELNGIAPEYRNEARMTIRAVDRKKIKSYVSRVSQHDTSLGNVLRQYTLSEMVLDPAEITRRAKIGEIMLIDLARDNRRHLAHVGITDERLVSLSDDGETLDMAAEQRFAVFIFNPLVR